MLTELEQFKVMLERAEVKFSDKELLIGTNISIEGGVGKNNYGYAGFVASFVFNTDGKLNQVHIAE